jgi:hypothetical protein
LSPTRRLDRCCPIPIETGTPDRQRSRHTHQDPEVSIPYVINPVAAELSLGFPQRRRALVGLQIRSVDDPSYTSECGEQDGTANMIALELQTPAGEGCMWLALENGEWRVIELSRPITR